MSNSVTLAIKASQHRQNLKLTDPQQVILQTRVVKEVERHEDVREDSKEA